MWTKVLGGFGAVGAARCDSFSCSCVALLPARASSRVGVAPAASQGFNLKRACRVQLSCGVLPEHVVAAASRCGTLGTVDCLLSRKQAACTPSMYGCVHPGPGSKSAGKVAELHLHRPVSACLLCCSDTSADNAWLCHCAASAAGMSS